MESVKWRDHKGRVVEIHTMSNRWLNNIRKYLSKEYPENPALPLIKNEIKRRKP